VRDSDDARAAELAVTVLDDWQGRGLGPVLLDELTERARAAGIGQFTALVAADNVAAIRSVQSRNSDVSLEYDPESHSVQYEIPLGVG
jgi:ribosomal protein S18 acetylase RimI-like enzyme